MISCQRVCIFEESRSNATISFSQKRLKSTYDNNHTCLMWKLKLLELMLPIKIFQLGTQETNKENQNSWRTYPSKLDTNPDRGVNRKNGRMKRTKRKVARHRRNRTKNVSKIDRSRCRLVSASSLRLTQHSSTTTQAILASRLGLHLSYPPPLRMTGRMLRSELDSTDVINVTRIQLSNIYLN